MAVATYEGYVQDGQIHLRKKVHLPENTKVYVVVPDAKSKSAARITSPRLAHPEQAERFKMEVSEEKAGA